MNLLYMSFINAPLVDRLYNWMNIIIEVLTILITFHIHYIILIQIMYLCEILDYLILQTVLQNIMNIV